MVIKIGSDEWAMTLFNSRAIARLIDDLRELDRSGFKEEVCIPVKSALRTLVEGINKPVGPAFLPSVISDYDRLLQTYEEWNNFGTEVDPDTVNGRRERVEELSRIRRAIQRKLRARRKTGATPVTRADREILKTSVAKLEFVVTQNPTIFPRLRKALSKRALKALHDPTS
jgi:hypothetical protein